MARCSCSLCVGEKCWARIISILDTAIKPRVASSTSAQLGDSMLCSRSSDCLSQNAFRKYWHYQARLWMQTGVRV